MRRRLLLALVAAPIAGPSIALLGGCGFRPLYAGPQGEAVSEELASIEVRAPQTRLGRILQNRLIDDLNPAGLLVAKRYRLELALEQSRQALAIQLDDSITRYDLTLAAFFSLREGDDPGPAGRDMDEALEEAEDRFDVLPEIGEETLDEQVDDIESEAESAGDAVGPLYRSAVRRVASYNVINDPFATLIAEQAAERQAAVEVSREIRTLLAVFFETAAA
jgi:hypothetical protein